jgi:metal-responsive CopG/Arc/MetJ family transcriptional regulator
MKVDAEGLEIKQVLVGIHRYQWQRLEKLCKEHRGSSRSEIVREALDLWLRGYDLQNPAEEEDARTGNNGETEDSDDGS